MGIGKSKFSRFEAKFVDPNPHTGPSHISRSPSNSPVGGVKVEDIIAEGDQSLLCGSWSTQLCPLELYVVEAEVTIDISNHQADEVAAEVPEEPPREEEEVVLCIKCLMAY
nr:hypothetical protein Itr_chr08CG08930 [Ipomoea trifida]